MQRVSPLEFSLAITVPSADSPVLSFRFFSVWYYPGVKDNDWPKQFRDPSSPWFWWWRMGTENVEYDGETHTMRKRKEPQDKTKAAEWKDRIESCAWRYELARRQTRNDNLPPFPNAEEWLWDGMTDLASITKVYRYNDIPFDEDFDIWDDERNWSRVLNVQWNLSKSNKELVRAFIQLVEQERQECPKKRPKTKGPIGKRNRHRSWRWAELLDIAHAIRTPRLNDNERSILSQARRAAEGCHIWLSAYLSE